MKRAVVPMLVAAAVTAGCSSNTGGTGQRSSTPSPTTPSRTTQPKPMTATITLGGQKFAVTLPAGARFGATSTGKRDSCTFPSASINDQNGDRLALVQLAPAGCEGNGKQAINGYLGSFATPADVARQAGQVPLRTVPAGKLATFTERYTQCTNSCTDYGLDVAVVFLTHPASPRLPAINIIDTTDLDGTDGSGYSVADVAASLQAR